MQIQSVQNYSVTRQTNPQFKSAYPVVHWVAEANSSYAPAVSYGLNKKLHRTLVSLLNKTSKLSQTMHGKDLIMKLAQGDKAYRVNSFVRSFYNKKGGFDEKFVPVSYLITGDDAKEFSHKLGRPLGLALTAAPRKNGDPLSAELNQAMYDYSHGGRKFVTDPEKRIYDSNGMEYTLHTKFQTIRTKTGRVKGYNLIDIKFCPVKGPDNPFVRVGLVKNKD